MKTITHTLKDGTLITAFEGDHISNIIAKTNYYYEGGMLDYIKANIPMGVMVDVGANIGNHTLFLAKYCATEVIACEPFPETYNVLVKNIEQNNIDNVWASNCALSNENTKVKMSLESGANVGMAKISEAGSISVEARLFDHVVQDEDPITLIKIDCEGYEEKALLGMIETIKQHKPALFIECQTDKELLAISNILIPLGYKSIYKFNATPTYYFRYEI